MLLKAPAHQTTRTILLTALAMLAFAANSLLCRLALGPHLIDAATFTSVRAISGAAALSAITLMRAATAEPTKADWRSAAMLFTYMVFFSFAYLSLGAGTGALVLFASVQLTMFTVALRAGERFSLLSWAGFTLAGFGLIYLVSPGLTAPDPVGALPHTSRPASRSGIVRPRPASSPTPRMKALSKPPMNPLPVPKASE